MGRFWLNNRFVRKEARRISVYAQMIFVALSCHANKQGETFVGQRKMAKMIGINKDTVTKHLKELEASGFIRRLGPHVNGKVSVWKIYTVPNPLIRPPQAVGHKEVDKEVYKEEQKKNIKRIDQMKRDAGLI